MAQEIQAEMFPQRAKWVDSAAESSAGATKFDGNRMDLVRIRAPFASHMSFGPWRP